MQEKHSRRDFLKGIAGLAVGLVGLGFAVENSPNADIKQNRSYSEFKQLKKELESDGFKYVGNSSTSEEIYGSRIFWEERFDHKDIRMAEVRRQMHFANEVEERTWNFQDRGYRIVKTLGYDIYGNPHEDLVAFFVKPIVNKS